MPTGMGMGPMGYPGMPNAGMANQMQNPFLNMGPVPGGMSRGGSSSPAPITSYEDYIKKLDDKIAELEKEEAEQAAKQQKEKYQEKVDVAVPNEVARSEEEVAKDIEDVFNHKVKEEVAEISEIKEEKTVDKDKKDDDFFDDFFGSEDE